MKKALIIIGYFVLFLICFATLFKMMHWPGAGPLFVLGDFFFCIVFLPLFFIQRMISQKTALNTITNIFGLLTTWMIFMGIMFKMMHWPGAGPMLVLGTILFVAPTLILYVVQQFKEYDRKFSEFWKLVAGTILICVFLIFWGLKPSLNLITGYLKVEDETLKANKSMEIANDRMHAMVIRTSDPAIIRFADELHASTSEVVTTIENIKTGLISTVEHNPEAPKDHWQINSLDNYDIPSHILGNAESHEGIELHDQLVNYKKEILEKISTLSFADKEKMIADLGDLGISTEARNMPEGYEGFGTWQENMFYENTLASALATLSSLQNQVLNAEFTTLGAVADREAGTK
ncbi:MAG: gliding motility-associated protein GldL [Bacteroidetes bacterium]|nr:gliding motility-associated protein GldL [Bacteroidota bacterium]